jgi:hypothetical protein
MKRLFLLWMCAVSFAAANAQVKVAAKGGFNFSTMVGEDAADAHTKIGLHVGGLIQLPVTKQFSFQPEVVFSTQGAKTDLGSADDFRINLNYLNIPILAKYKTTSGFFAETGPQMSFLLNAQARGGDKTADVQEFYRKSDFGWALGLGYEVSQIGVNARYNLGLTSIREDDGNIKTRNGVFQLGVYYVLKVK